MLHILTFFVNKISCIFLNKKNKKEINQNKVIFQKCYIPPIVTNDAVSTLASYSITAKGPKKEMGCKDSKLSIMKQNLHLHRIRQ